MRDNKLGSATTFPTPTKQVNFQETGEKTEVPRGRCPLLFGSTKGWRCFQIRVPSSVTEGSGCGLFLGGATVVRAQPRLTGPGRGLPSPPTGAQKRASRLCWPE